MSLFKSNKSKNFDQLFSEGMRQYAFGNLNGAVDKFSEAIKIDPNLPRGYYQRGMCYARMSIYSKAIVDFEQVYHMRVPTLERDVCYNLGKAYEEIKNFEKALDWYSKCITADENFANAYANRSVVHTKLAVKKTDIQEFKLALKDIDQCLKLNPADALAYYNRATVNNALNNHDQIPNDLNKFLQYAPKNHPYIPEVKRILAEVEKPSSSKVDKIRARKQEELLKKILKTNNEKNYQEGIRLCDEFLKDKRTAPVVWDEKAFALWNLGSLEEALKVCNEGISVNPGAARLFNTKGGLLLDLKKFREAIGAFEKYLAIAPKEYDHLFPAVKKSIEYAEQQLQDPLKLLLEREQLFRKNSQFKELQATLGSLGVLFKDAGRIDQAMAYFTEQEQICRKIGNKDGLQCALGDQANILFGQGKLEESLRLHSEEEQICRKMKNLKGLQGALGNKGAVLLSYGKVNEAMALFREKEKICREIKEVNGLITALANQGLIYAQKINDPCKARLLVEEAIELAENAGLTSRAQQMKELQAQMGG